MDYPPTLPVLLTFQPALCAHYINCAHIHILSSTAACRQPWGFGLGVTLPHPTSSRLFRKSNVVACPFNGGGGCRLPPKQNIVCPTPSRGIFVLEVYQCFSKPLSWAPSGTNSIDANVLLKRDHHTQRPCIENVWEHFLANFGLVYAQKIWELRLWFPKGDNSFLQ